jgi:hypothetical protein
MPTERSGFGMNSRFARIDHERGTLRLLVTLEKCGAGAATPTADR